MPKGIMVVQSAPSDPAREEEYNQWYSGSHIPEVLAVPGIVSARRYKPTGAGGDYLAVYDLDAEDLSALAGKRPPVQNLARFTSATSCAWIRRR